MMRTLRLAAKVLALTSTTIGGVSSAHLLLLLGAAVRSRRGGSPSPCDTVALAVVIPAHDEEGQISATVASVLASRYSQANLRIVVVADNCSDQTAATARSAGAEVWERSDPVRRGKGHALAWGFERLLKDDSIEAVVVIDADCEISWNLLAALATRIRAGEDAVQAAYVVSNPDASANAALRWAGFALINVVRPLGRNQLGLSSGLLGSGMAFSRELLLRSPWQAFSFAEDREQHMRWVLSGTRVTFAREAEVRSPSPGSSAGSRVQEARWDSGRARLAVAMTPKLLAWSLSAGDLVALDAALEPLLPPQALLLGTNLVAVAASGFAGARLLTRLAAASLLGQCAYVVGGLVLLDAPVTVWRASLSVPRFLGRRVSVLAGSVVGRGPSEWQRTPRQPEASSQAH